MAYLQRNRRSRLGTLGGPKESDTATRRKFHLEAKTLHTNRHIMPPIALYHATEYLKNEIAPYRPWDGCGFPVCPLNSYLSKHEITERLREANVFARTRMTNAERASQGMSFITQATRDSRSEGVEQGIQESEASRGKSTAQLTAENVPGEIVARAKEMFESSTEWADFMGKWKTPIFTVAIVVGAAWLFRPYMEGLNKTLG